MKKLNPFLLAGLFSSLVFIVNCDSNSARSIKAAMPAKKQDTSNLPPCTEPIMTLVNARKKMVDDLNKKYNEYKSLDLDQAKKAELNTMIDGLRNKSNDTYTAIKALKGAPAGCNSVTTDNKKSPVLIEAMKSENRTLGKKVAELTGQSNILANSSEENDATTLIENQKYEFKSELLQMMKRSNLERFFIKDGKVTEIKSGMDDIKAMSAKADNEFCYLNSSSDEVSENSNFNIFKIAHKESEDKKTVSSRVIFIAEGGQLNSFACQVKTGTEVPTKLRSLFGELITLKNGVGSRGDVSIGD
jgi:hypothetical protein